MKYTAEVTNKDLFDGLLVVQVRYISEDGSKIIQDSYSTRSGQDDNWLQNNINRKLKELEELEVFVEKIPLGQIQPKKDPLVTNDLVDENTKQFILDLSKLNSFNRAIQLGLVSEEDTKFKDLQQKVKNSLTDDLLKYV